MEGYGTWVPTQPGYLNPDTAFFYPRPEITGNNLTLYQVYVSPQGNDAASNNGVITSPFATISAALFYVTTVSVAFPTPLSAPVCIFVAPGTYEGGFSVPDNVYLIGPSNSPEPVIIAGSIFVSPSSSSSPTGLQNLTLNGLTVAGAFYNANVEIRNCRIQTETIFSALTIAPDDPLVTATVSATECLFSSSDTGNVSLISGNTTENTNLTLDNCQLVSNAEEGVLIDMTGSLTVRNCSLLNTGVGTTLSPLILLQSGETLTPTVSLEGSVLKYEDLQTDAAGNKLAIKFNAPTQPITAKMTNCTISIHLGASQTDIVKNIGAANITFTQSANSCLEDGKTIDTTNIVLPAAFFLQDSPLPPPPAGGVTFLNSIAGAITLAGAGTVSVGTVGSTITVTGSVPVDSVGGKTGAVAFEEGDGIAITYGPNNAAPINIANAGVLSVVAGEGISLTDDTPQNPTINVVARTYTLLGATTGGVITYTKASGAGNTWTANTWILANTIQINVPPGWVAGQSVGFDGYEYLNWDANVASYFAIYYVTPSQPTEQSLIGTTTPGSFADAIFASNGGQAYLPMNLTIPPTYLVSGSTITLRVYGLLTSATHYLAADPTIDARVNIVYP